MTQQEMADRLKVHAETFENMTIDRHKMGAERYGSLTFLGADVIQMMLEELADTVNYCRYQAVKLMMLQELLCADPKVQGLSDQSDRIEIGLGAFSRSGEEWDK